MNDEVAIRDGIEGTTGAEEIDREIDDNQQGVESELDIEDDDQTQVEVGVNATDEFDEEFNLELIDTNLGQVLI